MNFTTAKQLLEQCESKNISISHAMIQREISLLGTDEKAIRDKMQDSYNIMKNSAKQALTTPLKSMGGLIGGNAIKISERRNKAATVCGDIVSKAICYAMGVLEVNASMGLIVASPTAGSSGVIPGSFLALQEEFGFTDDKIVEALLNASAIGYLISLNATVSGAEGGCQAEVGAASAMAASGIVQLMGGTPNQCLHAASMALSNIMGLICDPIAGLVEVPCQTRNSMGASNALISAEMSLSGVDFIVPFDETVEAMYNVGRKIPREFRETALGGIAATKTARSCFCSVQKQCD